MWYEKAYCGFTALLTAGGAVATVGNIIQHEPRNYLAAGIGALATAVWGAMTYEAYQDIKKRKKTLTHLRAIEEEHQRFEEALESARADAERKIDELSSRLLEKAKKL